MLLEYSGRRNIFLVCANSKKKMQIPVYDAKVSIELYILINKVLFKYGLLVNKAYTTAT